MVELVAGRRPARDPAEDPTRDTAPGPDPARATAEDPAPTGSPARPPAVVGWGALWSAIALNVVQVFVLDGSDGLRQPALLPLAAAGFLVELALFGRAIRCLSPVIAYAAYGATPAVVTVLSVGLFGEPLTLAKFAGVALVTTGIVLLATAGTASPPRTGCIKAG